MTSADVQSILEAVRSPKGSQHEYYFVVAGSLNHIIGLIIKDVIHISCKSSYKNSEYPPGPDSIELLKVGLQ